MGEMKGWPGYGKVDQGREIGERACRFLEMWSRRRRWGSEVLKYFLPWI
jgi:hypothetical protein